MSKVQCTICGEIGYTASPNYTRCECGGKFMVIPEAVKGREFNRIKRYLNFLIYSVLLKPLCA